MSSLGNPKITIPSHRQGDGGGGSEQVGRLEDKEEEDNDEDGDKEEDNDEKREARDENDSTHHPLPPCITENNWVACVGACYIDTIFE